MIAVVVVCWMLVGVLTVPMVVSYMNRHDDLIRDAAMEALVGVVLGPVPLLMVVLHLMLSAVGRASWWITRRSCFVVDHTSDRLWRWCRAWSGHPHPIGGRPDLTRGYHLLHRRL